MRKYEKIIKKFWKILKLTQKFWEIRNILRKIFYQGKKNERSQAFKSATRESTCNLAPEVRHPAERFDRRRGRWRRVATAKYNELAREQPKRLVAVAILSGGHRNHLVSGTTVISSVSRSDGVKGRLCPPVYAPFRPYVAPQMACLNTLKQEIKTLESVFPKSHERFQIMSASVDELSCRFVGKNGKKYEIHANITVSATHARERARARARTHTAGEEMGVRRVPLSRRSLGPWCAWMSECVSTCAYVRSFVGFAPFCSSRFVRDTRRCPSFRTSGQRSRRPSTLFGAADGRRSLPRLSFLERLDTDRLFSFLFTAIAKRPVGELATRRRGSVPFRGVCSESRGHRFFLFFFYTRQRQRWTQTKKTRSRISRFDISRLIGHFDNAINRRRESIFLSLSLTQRCDLHVCAMSARGTSQSRTILLQCVLPLVRTITEYENISASFTDYATDVGVCEFLFFYALLHACLNGWVIVHCVHDIKVRSCVESLSFIVFFYNTVLSTAELYWAARIEVYDYCLLYHKVVILIYIGNLSFDAARLVCRIRGD